MSNVKSFVRCTDLLVKLRDCLVQRSAFISLEEDSACS